MGTWVFPGQGYFLVSGVEWSTHVSSPVKCITETCNVSVIQCKPSTDGMFMLVTVASRHTTTQFLVSLTHLLWSAISRRQFNS